MKKTIDKPLLATLREMEIGQTISVPASRHAYAKFLCCEYGWAWRKKFTARNDRKNWAVRITRVK